ncbi:MFS transporter [Amycolatopsis sp. WGS_07]|uniref:MFS transporter n=1 Tax=Amycolatopsis sp. WGS_07 TaxID=3076764 RepID=UPI003873A28B
MGLLPRKGAPRLLAAATLVAMTGYGVYLTAGALFFTRGLHLPAGQVGLGMSVAGGVSLAVGIPAGHLADRFGARPVYALTLALSAVAMAGLLLSGGFWTFLLFVTLGAIAQTAGLAARSPLVRAYGGDRPAEFRGYLRSVTNLGIAGERCWPGGASRRTRVALTCCSSPAARCRLRRVRCWCCSCPRWHRGRPAPAHGGLLCGTSLISC